MAEFLIGLDVGTTATKALLFDAQGRVVAAAGRSYGLLTPQAERVEQDPGEIWAAVVEVLRRLSTECSGRNRIVALSQSSQGGTTIAVDREGRPLYRAISWMDQRAREEASEVERRWGAETIRTITGWPLSSGLPLQHIAWLRRHCPAEFEAAALFLFVNDWIGYRLTGQLCTNPSDAGITQLMSLECDDWDERLLATAGIRREQLSPIRPSGALVGKLARAAAEATGLPQDLLVTNGAHDQYCAAVGTGVTRPGRALLSCGTAWVVLAVPESLDVGLSSGMAISRHAVQGRWGAIRSLGAVGRSLEWLLEQVWGGARADRERDELYEQMDEEASRVAAGADGVLFMPMAGGHGAGYGTASRAHRRPQRHGFLRARGGFVNLSIGHSRGVMARAVMEGTAFELRWAVDEMRAQGIDVAEFIMVGGAAKSRIWPRIVVDALGIPVTVPSASDAAARGAAILAAVGSGLYPDVDTACAAWRGDERSLAPTPDLPACYDRAYARYQDVARLLPLP